ALARLLATLEVGIPYVVARLLSKAWLGLSMLGAAAVAGWRLVAGSGGEGGSEPWWACWGGTLSSKVAGDSGGRGRGAERGPRRWRAGGTRRGRAPRVVLRPDGPAGEGRG